IGAPVVVLTVPDATQPPFPPAQRIGPAEVWYSRPDGSGGTYIDLLVRSGLARTIAGDAAHGEISLIRTGRIPERGRASV
ncbi:MAG: hypothetical protein J2O47_10600, partial [Acidimicrobiaceae bacterium]|nr:hypothetical protein [Acidimicrobiaceae bacterium]